MSLGNRIRDLRVAQGRNQDDLAQMLDLTRPAVGRWESPDVPSRDWTSSSSSPGCSAPRPTTLLNGTDGPPPAQALPPRARRVAGRSGTVPMRRLGRRTRARPSRRWSTRAWSRSPAHVAALHPHGFCLEVKGHCMDRAYPDGCVVLVDPDAEPWPGCAVVAETGPGESVLRRYNRGAATLMLSPDSHDPGFADMVFDDEELQEVRTLGVVVWYQAPHDEFEEFVAPEDEGAAASGLGGRRDGRGPQRWKAGNSIWHAGGSATRRCCPTGASWCGCRAARPWQGPSARCRGWWTPTRRRSAR